MFNRNSNAFCVLILYSRVSNYSTSTRLKDWTQNWSILSLFKTYTAPNKWMLCSVLSALVCLPVFYLKLYADADCNQRDAKHNYALALSLANNILQMFHSTGFPLDTNMYRSRHRRSTRFIRGNDSARSCSIFS